KQNVFKGDKKMAWMDYLLLSGRLEQKPFIKRYLIVFLCTIAVYYSFSINFPVFLSWPGLMLTTFSSISLVLRRCHDIGFSGKVTALIVIVFSLPLINLLFAIILASIKSQKGRNIYG
ncbi:MAG: DUF805 domain-containing protein, partial [Acidaminococcaceae bacterium]|nr:DUF805 domain-containing protein [Acidaminococcaceae bacterium]MBP8743330.1 DUF805 domain-containing protein [Acidaminococcaceae bacterium]